MELDPTIPEKVLVLRRRRGQSQPAAAAAAGVTLYRYRSFELGDSEPPDGHLDGFGALAEHEVLFLRRKRAGLEAWELAATLDVSRWWLCQMEHGKAPLATLAQHWASVAAREAKPWRGAAAGG